MREKQNGFRIGYGYRYIPHCGGVIDFVKDLRGTSHSRGEDKYYPWFRLWFIPTYVRGETVPKGGCGLTEGTSHSRGEVAVTLMDP
jgi:hypothetical protein